MARKKKLLYPADINATVASKYPIAKIDDDGHCYIGFKRPVNKWLGFNLLTEDYPNHRTRWQYGVTADEETGVDDEGSNFGMLRCLDDKSFDWVMIMYRTNGYVLFLHAISADDYFEFSPDITKDTGIEDPGADDYLDWALRDAEKPKKPYEGMFIQEGEKGVNKKVNEEANKHGVFTAQDQIDKYGKSIGKMSLGTALWAKAAREEIRELRAEVAELKQIIFEKLSETK
jgi:hypothetical protein